MLDDIPACHDAFEACKLYLEDKYNYDRGQKMPFEIVVASGRGDVNEGSYDKMGLRLSMNLVIIGKRIPLRVSSPFEESMGEIWNITDMERRMLTFAIRDAFYQRITKPRKRDSKLSSAVLTIGGSKNVLVGWDGIWDTERVELGFPTPQYKRRW